MSYEKRSNIDVSPAHVQRMVAEHAELADKIDKLTAFLDTPLFAQLDDEDQKLLATQLGAMGAYVGALELRLARAGV